MWTAGVLWCVVLSWGLWATETRWRRWIKLGEAAGSAMPRSILLDPTTPYCGKEQQQRHSLYRVTWARRRDS